MKYCAVIDTNVVVSALLNRKSTPGIIIEEALCGHIIPVLHDDIIEEYAEVLCRPKFKFNKESVAIVLAGLISRGIFMGAVPISDYVADPDDAVFYKVVMGARKSKVTYLITGNTKHFPVKTFIVTPAEMLQIINTSK